MLTDSSIINKAQERGSQHGIALEIPVDFLMNVFKS